MRASVESEQGQRQDGFNRVSVTARAPRPAFRGEYAEAVRLCERWAGLRPGDAFDCKSNLIGREVELRHGRKRERVRIESCLVPRSDKPSKRCAPDYLARISEPGKLPFSVRLDGGHVRNATRTPRPTHDPAVVPPPDLPSEWRLKFYRAKMRENVSEGLPAFDGLDLPFRHRVGSSVCCPEHPLSAPVLREALRWAGEGEGIGPELGAQLVELARHLRDKHRQRVEVPAAIGPDDFEAAEAVLAASDGYCAAYLTGWEETAEDQVELRRVERKKHKRKSTTAATKTKRKEAVQRSMRHTRSELVRALAKSSPAAALRGADRKSVKS